MLLAVVLEQAAEQLDLFGHCMGFGAGFVVQQVKGFALLGPLTTLAHLTRELAKRSEEKLLPLSQFLQPGVLQLELLELRLLGLELLLCGGQL